MQYKNLFAGVVVGATTLAFAGVANGQNTYTWDGDQDNGNWFDSGNWAGGTVPTNDTQALVIIASAAFQQPVLDFSDGSATGNDIIIGALEVQSGAFLTVLDTGSSDDKLVVTDAHASRDGHVTVEADGLFQVGEATGSDLGVVEVEGEVTLEVNGSDLSILRVEYADSVVTMQDKLILQANGTVGAALEIQEGEVDLTLAGSHEIGGDIVLSSGSSGLLVSETMTFEPYDDNTTDRFGFVLGEDDDALIQIADDKQLTNNIWIQGGMMIAPAPSSDATFVNERVDSNGTGLGDALSGVVRAVNGLTIEFHASLVIDDTTFMQMYRPEWSADGSGSKLEFNQNAGDCAAEDPLVGDFIFTDSGVLFLNSVNIQTSGTYDGPSSPSGNGCILSQCLDIFGSCV